jgi:hypothetical protein
MKQRHSFQNESELAAVVVDWLKVLKYEVYQEVTNPWGRADIVAVNGPVTWVIETKMTLGFGVFDQACRYIGLANYISVATPSIYTNRETIRKLCAATGIGVLRVFGGRDGLAEGYAPKLHRCRDSPFCPNIRKYCREEQKTWGAAGSKSDFYSPFKATCREVSQFVSQNNGCTMKELMGSLKHHYYSTTTAKSLLPRYIDQGLVPGVTCDRSGRAIRLIYSPVELLP